MSIASEITRLQNAKADIKSSIEEKGVTVPSTATLDEYSELIDSIPSGGGDIDWSAIGFDGMPQAIQDGYDYAIEIMENWDPAATLESKFYRDYDLLFMPPVDITKQRILNKMFQYCSSLMEIAELDYSQASYLDNIFDGCSKLIIISNFNTRGRLQYAFQRCTKLETISGNINTNNLQWAFNECSNLKNIPVIYTHDLGSTAFRNTFLKCTSLTDASLDNILQTCINATSYTGTKTLAYLGITDTTIYPTSRIEALPHYQDFLNAGWTIGY